MHTFSARWVLISVPHRCVISARWVHHQYGVTCRPARSPSRLLDQGDHPFIHQCHIGVSSVPDTCFISVTCRPARRPSRRSSMEAMIRAYNQCHIGATSVPHRCVISVRYVRHQYDVTCRPARSPSRRSSMEAMILSSLRDSSWLMCSRSQSATIADSVCACE
jgi:hypothetical protein